MLHSSSFGASRNCQNSPLSDYLKSLNWMPPVPKHCGQPHGMLSEVDTLLYGENMLSDP